MTRVLVYEYCTAQGLGRSESDPAHSLFREGKAMRDALLADLQSADDIEAISIDEADGDPEDAIRDGADGCDWVVVIAPELDGILERCSDAVWETDARLLGPAVETIRLTADKLAMYERWDEFFLPTPPTWTIEDWTGKRFPVIWKPRRGAGSTATFRLNSTEDVEAIRTAATAEGYPDAKLVVQPFAHGLPASVSFLVGPDDAIPMIPTFQLISADGRFRYQGGELPIHPDLAERAVELGRKAVECTPHLLGYVGVDLVLGESPDGSRDVVIEINPRLTTSYVGLREAARFNIAEAMVKVASGEEIPEPRWKPGRVRFRADGSIERLAGAEKYFRGTL